MTVPSSRDLALLKAFEGVLAEGRYLDETLGSLLDASLRFFDAVAVALLPAGGAPPMTRSAGSIVSSAAEQRLARLLEGMALEGKERRAVESGLAFVGAPVKTGDQLHGFFGVGLPHSAARGVELDDGIRAFAVTFARVLERERVVGTLVKRREEAVALFELAAGALHSLNADEVVRLTAASLARQLDFEQVQAFRYYPETREIEHILGQGTAPGIQGYKLGERLPIESDEAFERALTSHAPAFEDDATATGGTGAPRRRRLAVPLEAGSIVFGFLSMSRRGAFVLTTQEMRLVKELARLAAGALEKARLIDAERGDAERVHFVNRIHGALAGATEMDDILDRTVKEVGAHFDFDLCALHLLPASDAPGAAAFRWKHGAPPARVAGELPRALFARLAADGAAVLLPDVSAEAGGLSLVPAPEVLKDLERPLSLVAVPVASRGEITGVLAAVSGGRPRAFAPPLLRSFQAIAVEVSLAVTSARLLQRERESYRFLDRLREVGRALAGTFDGARIKHSLCEQAVALLKAESAQFWDADPQTKSLRTLAHFGAESGSEGPRVVLIDDATHPVIKAFLEKSLLFVPETEVARLYPPPPGQRMPHGLRAAVVPLAHNDDVIGLLSVAFRAPGEPWSADLGSRLALLADAGALALHNSRLMKIIEQQTERDSLTGLYNQSAVLKRLESEIRRAERSGQPLAVAHVRVDGLEESVKRFGAAFGDTVLPKVAAQLVRATRSVNIVGRDRGDRFWILIFEAGKATGQKAVVSIQRNFEAGIDQRLEAAGLRLSLTIGLAAYPEDAFDTASLLGRAEEALDDAIKMGAGRVALYGALAPEDAEAYGS